MGPDEEVNAVQLSRAERCEQERYLLTGLAERGQLPDRVARLGGNNNGVAAPVPFPKDIAEGLAKPRVGGDGEDNRHHRPTHSDAATTIGWRTVSALGNVAQALKRLFHPCSQV